jgi:hypothetical protein
MEKQSDNETSELDLVVTVVWSEQLPVAWRGVQYDNTIRNRTVHLYSTELGEPRVHAALSGRARRTESNKPGSRPAT